VAKLTDEQKRKNRIKRKRETYAQFNDHGREKCLIAFQKLRRLQEADDCGWCTCVSCGARHAYDDLDAGHYVSRDNNTTAFDPRNVNPQCRACNRKPPYGKGGNPEGYRKFLGDEVADELKAKGRKTAIYKDFELAEMCVEFDDLIKIEMARIQPHSHPTTF